MANDNNNNHESIIDSLNKIFLVIELAIKNKKNNILYDISLDSYYNDLFLYLKTSVILHSMATNNHRSIRNTKVNVQLPLYDFVDNDMIRELKLFINTKDNNILKDNSHCNLTQKFDDLRISKALETVYGIILAYESVYNEEVKKRRSFTSNHKSSFSIVRGATWCCTWFIVFIICMVIFFTVLIILGQILQFILEYFL